MLLLFGRSHNIMEMKIIRPQVAVAVRKQWQNSGRKVEKKNFSKGPLT